MSLNTNGKSHHLHFAAVEPLRQDILVIGGAGYIGSALLPKLLDAGHRVRLMDLFLYGREPIGAVADHPNLEVVEADFRQLDRLIQAMDGVDAVVHLGGIVGDPACALDEEFTKEVNVWATKVIADCAKGIGVPRFVFASTCSVYGASDDLLTEGSHLNPVSLYARTKIGCERFLRSMATERFQPTILRFGTVYGFSGRVRFDLVVNLLTAKAIVDRQITVFGEEQWRPFVHVDDAALAVVAALQAPTAAVAGETFNVGSNDQNLTLGDVGRLIKRLVPEAELVCSPVDGDRRNYRVDFTKIERKLGYAARWTIERGVSQVIEAMQNGQVSDYRSSEYSNVKYLSEESRRDAMRTERSYLEALVEGDPNERPLGAPIPVAANLG